MLESPTTANYIFINNGTPKGLKVSYESPLYQVPEELTRPFGVPLLMQMQIIT